MQKDGLLVELSQVSNLVAAISGKVSGDERFFFPKEMKSSEQNWNYSVQYILSFRVI